MRTNNFILVTIIKVLFIICQFMAAHCLSVGAPSSSGRFIGFDLGTSGARISIIQKDDSSTFQEIYSQAISWDKDRLFDDPNAWMDGIQTLLAGANDNNCLDSVISICVSGTSASCVLIDRTTQTLVRPSRMYNYDVVASASNNKNDEKNAAKKQQQYGIQAVELLDKYTPPQHTARARTGTLAKLVTWALERPLQDNEVLCHQSDYCSMKLMGDANIIKSDWHNCLKLGYDVRSKKWPEWIETCLKNCGIAQPFNVIPTEVVSPGQPMGTISKEMSKLLGLPDTVKIVGGTTDSNAAFFAAVGSNPTIGTAVTSLGSTLAIKQLSKTYIEDANRGVYSHRFPTLYNDDNEDIWLVGGASNVGCAVLRQLKFDNHELEQLSSQIDPMVESNLVYYPLTKRGERFPVADSDKEPLLEPVPNDRKDFLHGILQGISSVERDGFKTLVEMGAPLPSMVWTAGGGSRNDMWNTMRQRRLSDEFGSVTVKKALCTEASYGAALVAASSFIIV